MKTKITDLVQTDSFDDGDLIWLRKSANPYDHSITYANMLKSLGNSAAIGFAAASPEANKIVLTPATEIILDRYYHGMKISFVSPINSDGLVQVKIGTLAYKNLEQLNTVQTSILVEGNYFEAIYNSTDNKFYQTNLSTPTLYSNEYIATSVVAVDLSSTTISLASAIGAAKQAYYAGMSLIFVADTDTKGALIVNVDGLGQKVLADPDASADNLSAGEAIFAIYDGTKFIKHMFSNTEPIAPPINPDIPEPDLPDANKKTINVGPAFPVKTITDAIQQLRNSYGDDGGNRLCTIQLADNFVWSETVMVNGIKLGWITIKSGNSTLISLENYALRAINGGSIRMTGTYIDNIKTYTIGLAHNADSEIVLINCNFVRSNTSTSINSFRWESGSVGNIVNCTFTGMSQIIINNSVMNLSNCTFANPANNENIFNSFDSKTNIVSCTFTNTISTGRMFNVSRGASFTMADSTITSTIAGQIFNTAQAKNITLTNVSMRAPITSQTLLAQNGAEVLVDGGDYRNTDDVARPNNIGAYNQGSIVRLKNTPLGGNNGTSAGGQVITI